MRFHQVFGQHVTSFPCLGPVEGEKNRLLREDRGYAQYRAVLRIGRSIIRQINDAPETKLLFNAQPCLKCMDGS